jgi:ATP-dependent DNA helicase DinG
MIGVPEELVAFIRVDESPFPVQNRLIYLENIGEMRFKDMDKILPLIVDSVDRILDKHAYEKGIIHCTNYTQVNYIQNNISRHNKERLTLTKTGTPQPEIIKSHNAKENSVLLSPSMAEGVDLKDSMSHFQIIVKVPFLPTNDKRIKIKMNKSSAWYEWHACLKLMQSYGRSVRNDNDYAVTYILDSKVNDLIKNKFITGWFKEAIV